MNAQNKGFSLLESLMATAILGANIIFYMNFQGHVTTSRMRDKALAIVADAGRVIQKNVNNRASCELIMQNPVDSVFTTLPKGKIDPNDFDNIIDTNELGVPNILGHGVEISSYKIIPKNGRHYLEAEFNLDVEDAKDIGVKKVIRHYLLNVKMNKITGNFEKCYSVQSNQIRSVAQITCESNGGKILPGTDDCEKNLQGGGEGVEEAEECTPGSTYKLAMENNKLKLECKPCVPVKKFVRSECKKGKDIRLNGLNWVNVCYYRTGCQDNRIDSLGSIFYEVGPTRARGGDTGREKSCYKKRRSCQYEDEMKENSEEIAEEEYHLAVKELNLAVENFNKFKQFANDKDVKSAIYQFGDVKVYADAAAEAAKRSIAASDIANTDKSKKFADKSRQTKLVAESIYKQSTALLNSLK